MDELTGTPDAALDTSVAADQSTEVTPDETPSFTDVDLSQRPGEGEDPFAWVDERHKQMRGDYTRKTQELATQRQEVQDTIAFMDALRTDPETQQAVLAELQEMLAGADETELTEDENPLETRLNQLENERATERQIALNSQIMDHIDHLAQEHGLELDDDDAKYLFDKATSGKIGKAETEAAVKAYADRQKARYDKWQKNYLQSKTTGTAQVPGGTSATEAPDLNDTKTRRARFAAILQGGD